MNKMKNLLALAMMLAVIPAKAGIKEIGTVNGVRLVRVKTAGVFAPSSTVILGYVPGRPGTLEVISSIGGTGVVPSVATAGGVVAGAALLRPSRTNVKNEGGNGGSSSSASGGSVIIENQPFVPPGHLNNPSNNH